MRELATGLVKLTHDTARMAFEGHALYTSFLSNTITFSYFATAAGYVAPVLNNKAMHL